MIYPDEPPRHLREFDPADWPAETDWASYELWKEAVKAFAEVHGWQGGPVAMVRLIRQTRQQLDRESSPG